MKKNQHLLSWLGSLLWAGLSLCSASGAAEKNPAPVKIIFDTDMAGDCDDCGALTVLHKLADFGEAEILACVADSRTGQQAVAASISAINTYYGRPGIPIGAYHGSKGKMVKLSRYAAELRDKFPHHALPDDQQPSALEVYRSTLAAVPEASVTIVSVGFFSNLRDLLESGPDKASPLSGMELVRSRVKKLVAMGGRFPESRPNQRGEYNFAWMNPLDTQYVVANWPTPILFSGVEIGSFIRTGKSLAPTPAANPVRRAYELYGKNCLLTGRPSWDLTAVLAAVRDPLLYWDISPAGTCEVASTGTDQWTPSPEGKHTYLIKKKPPEEVAALLDHLLAIPPGEKE